jgi:TusA-related sulfurtransferase
MTTEYEITETLDVTGLNCPLPVVKAKQAVDDLGAGDVLEVVATDPGTMSDFGGWASSMDEIELQDQEEVDEDGETLYRHYLERTA